MAESAKYFVTHPCIKCGKREEILIDRTKYNRWQSGEHIQNVWPEATPEWRELLITGIHAECWKEMFGGEEEE